MLELARRGPTHHFQPKWLRMRGARGGWSRYYDSKADAGKSDLKLGKVNTSGVPRSGSATSARCGSRPGEKDSRRPSRKAPGRGRFCHSRWIVLECS